MQSFCIKEKTNLFINTIKNILQNITLKNFIIFMIIQLCITYGYTYVVKLYINTDIYYCFVLVASLLIIQVLILILIRLDIDDPRLKKINNILANRLIWSIIKISIFIIIQYLLFKSYNSVPVVLYYELLEWAFLLANNNPLDITNFLNPSRGRNVSPVGGGGGNGNGNGGGGNNQGYLSHNPDRRSRSSSSSNSSSTNSTYSDMIHPDDSSHVKDMKFNNFLYDMEYKKNPNLSREEFNSSNENSLNWEASSPRCQRTYRELESRVVNHHNLLLNFELQSRGTQATQSQPETMASEHYTVTLADLGIHSNHPLFNEIVNLLNTSTYRQPVNSKSVVYDSEQGGGIIRHIRRSRS